MTGKRTRSDGAETRRSHIIKQLMDDGALKPESRVLDVGGGPGNWAVPLSKITAHVTVVEPSKAMVEILESRIAEENISNISVICKRWEAIDLESDGLDQHFDLVMSSMNPGVNDRKTLEKLMAASRGHCYMSGFSGLGRFEWFKGVWEKLFQEAISENPGDIIYPFNLLYAMGYKPKFNFTRWDSKDEMAVDDAVSFMVNFLWDYTDDTDDVRDIVKNYVADRAESGMFRSEQTICQGHLLWEVACV